MLLDDVRAFLGRFVIYPSEEAHTAHALWIAHCHFMDSWESTPRLAFLSAEPESGKTRALEISNLLVPNPVDAVNVSASYLFRKVAAGAPTILFDEVDTPWNDIRGKPLTDRGLAVRLRAYGIKPKLLRIGSAVSRGYRKEDFLDAWRRYLPSLPISE